MMTPLVWVILGILTVSLSDRAAPQDEIVEIRQSIQAFNDVVRRSRGNPILRVSAIQDLIIELDYARRSPPEGFGYTQAQASKAETEVARALDGLLDDSSFHVRQATVKALGSLHAPPVAAYLLEEVLENKRERSAVRQASAAASLGLLGYRPAIPALISAIDASDFGLQHAAISALGILAPPEAVDPLLAHLEEVEPALQTAIIDALVRIDERDKTVPRLLGLLDPHQPWQVRSVSIRALGILRRRQSIAPLIDLYQTEEGRLRDEIYRALQGLTGYDYGPYPERWQTWWKRSRERFVFPSDEEMARRKERSPESERRYAATPDTPTFAGLPTTSRRIVFVIDTSSSMEELITDRENFLLKDREFSSYEKMEIVKAELIRTLKALDKNVRFNIVAYATKVREWKRQLVPATGLTRRQAVDFVRHLEPIEGTASRIARATRRLPAASGMGKTNAYEALMTALGARKNEEYDRNYASAIDTIYFLSDGQPTVGKYVDPADIRAEVRRVNELRKVVIHTIAIGNFEKNFMRMLAYENGGEFIDLTPVQ